MEAAMFKSCDICSVSSSVPPVKDLYGNTALGPARIKY